MTIRAGKLRHYVTFQTPTETRGADGANIIDWTIGQVPLWVEIIPLAGKAYYAAQAFNAEITHQINMRYLSSINRKQRILYGSRIFEIEHVINIDEKKYDMQLLCKERI